MNTLEKMGNHVLKENREELVKALREELVKTLKASLYPGAKDSSINLVIAYCQHAKLDVMLKPVHIVPMWIVDKETGKGEMRDVIMPGINLYRIQASRNNCVGVSDPEFGEEVTECLDGVDVTYPKWCKITVKRLVNGVMAEFTALEFWKECYATGGKNKETGKKTKAPNDMWLKRSYGQLAKCAEAQAFRKGFPEIGSMPTAEEMEGKVIDTEELTSMQKHPGKGMDGVKELLGITSKIDDNTGEILDADFFNDLPSLSAVDKIKQELGNAKNKIELLAIAKKAADLSEEEKKEVKTVYNQMLSKL